MLFSKFKISILYSTTFNKDGMIFNNNFAYSKMVIYKNYLSSRDSVQILIDLNLCIPMHAFIQTL